MPHARSGRKSSTSVPSDSEYFHRRISKEIIEWQKEFLQLLNKEPKDDETREFEKISREVYNCLIEEESNVNDDCELKDGMKFLKEKDAHANDRDQRGFLGRMKSLGARLIHWIY